MKALVRTLFARLGLAVFRVRGHYAQDGLFTLHSDHFRADPAFQAAYRRGVQASDGVDPHFEWRVHVALWAARKALSVEGDFVECGVNAGFISSAIMEGLDWNRQERNREDRRFYLIDTFGGPVFAQYSHEEVLKQRSLIAKQAMDAGAYVTDIERIRRNFAEWRSAVVVQGAVPEILETIDFKRVAFLHIDMNCALPERSAFEFFWDRLSPGGLILMDDYAYYGHDCQRDAIDAAAQARRADILSLPTGQGLMIKPG